MGFGARGEGYRSRSNVDAVEMRPLNRPMDLVSEFPKEMDIDTFYGSHSWPRELYFSKPLTWLSGLKKPGAPLLAQTHY